MTAIPRSKKRKRNEEDDEKALQQRRRALPEGDSFYPDASGKLGEWQLADGSICHPRDCGAQPAGKRSCVWLEPSSKPRCYKHHEMLRHEKDPEYYTNSACCDVCGLPNL